MRRYHGLFRPSGAFFRLRFSADCNISMFGFDFRQGQVSGSLPLQEAQGVSIRGIADHLKRRGHTLSHVTMARVLKEQLRRQS